MRNKLIIYLLFNFLLLNTAFGEPANPQLVKIKQPDGSFLTVCLIGDEFSYCYQTSDGFFIRKNKKNIFEYASINDGKIVTSGIKANDIVKRTAEEKKYVATISSNFNKKIYEIIYAKRQRLTKKNVTKISSKSPIIGKKNIICILMEYPNMSFSKSQIDFYKLMNEEGYNGTGSVRDFYLENSYGKLDLKITVVGPYLAEHNFEYYGENKANGQDKNVRSLIIEALNKANSDVDYSNFDNDSDGILDGVHVIYAGHAENVAGNNSNFIWPHKWSISHNLDGLHINKYSCSSELRGVETDMNICGIGTTCHELGHVFGAPDFYDTDYSSNGQYKGTGVWDIMAYGGHNNSGDTPAHHNPYTKTKIFGWATLIELPNSGRVTLAPAEVHSDSFYKIKTNTSGEFFILENRQSLGFDNSSSFPGSGLMVYHVHSQFSSISQDNNITHPQKFYPVCASSTQDPIDLPSSYGNINTGGTPFPGTSNSQFLNFETTPSLQSWAGVNTERNLQFITETGNNITFVVNQSITGPDLICDQASYTIENLPANISVQWSTNNSNLTLVSGQGTATAVFHKNGNGECTVKASIANGAMNLEKEVSTRIIVRIEGPNLVKCNSGGSWIAKSDCELPSGTVYQWNLRGSNHSYSGSDFIFGILSNCSSYNYKEPITRQPINAIHDFYELELTVKSSDGLIYAEESQRVEVFGSISLVPSLFRLRSPGHQFFTPNNDGINDELKLSNLSSGKLVMGNHIVIYNSQGLVVYEGYGDENFRGFGNVGSYAGIALPEGVYFYKTMGRCTTSGSIYLRR